jgi:hypothetical protein
MKHNETMKIRIIFLIVLFCTKIEYASGDWPHYVPCPNITSVTEPAGNKNTSDGFTFYSSRSNEPYPAIKFIEADLNSTYTLNCYYEVSDGTRVTATFTTSKCSVSSGFDSSGKCNNSDPGQCMAVCSY